MKRQRNDEVQMTPDTPTAPIQQKQQQGLETEGGQQCIEERGASNRVVVNSPYGCSRRNYGWGTLFHRPLSAHIPEYPNIHIGISSLNGVPGKDRRMKTLFAQYAKKFNSLEHCYPYHNMGNETMWKDWENMCASQSSSLSSQFSTPESPVKNKEYNLKPPLFMFTIKANKYFTHTRMLSVDDESDESITQFFNNRCLRLGKHLGPVLVQLPPQFQKSRVNMERIERFAARVPNLIRVAVEFRHRSWYNEEVYELLRRVGWALVVTHRHDDPSGSIHVDTGVDFMYVRLHGPIGLYVGDYGPVILSQWAERIVEFTRGGSSVMRSTGPPQSTVANACGREVYFFFNNSDSHSGGDTSSTVDATFLAQRVKQILMEEEEDKEEADREYVVSDSHSDSCSIDSVMNITD